MSGMIPVDSTAMLISLILVVFPIFISRLNIHENWSNGRTNFHKVQPFFKDGDPLFRSYDVECGVSVRDLDQVWGFSFEKGDMRGEQSNFVKFWPLPPRNRLHRDTWC